MAKQESFAGYTPANNEAVKEAWAALMLALDSMQGQGMTELRSLKAPPQDVKDSMVLLGNFFRIDGVKDHTWVSVLTFLKTWPRVLDHVENFDYENVSGPQLTLIKKAPAHLLDKDYMKAKACCSVGVVNLLKKVQDYYLAKQQAIDLLQSRM